MSRPEIGLHKKVNLWTLKKQAVLEYLTQGFTYRQLANKYSVSRSTINTRVLVHQGIHDLPRSKRQNYYDLQQMKQGTQNPRHKANPECFQYKELKIRPQSPPTPPTEF